MHPIRTLMTGVLDYAGLFPPARLDMSMTVRNYAGYRAGPDSWMLGRLIVPCAQLGEFLAEFRAGGPAPEIERAGQPWRLSVLTAAAGDPALPGHLEAIDNFNALHGEYARVDSIELKADSPDAIDGALEVIPSDITPAFELPWSRDPRGLIAALAGSDAVAKVRTGGLTADLFPPPDALARFILACAAARVPFKATAGLHHPFRHPSRGVTGAREHGFVNVFLGAALAHHDAIDPDALTRLLDDEEPSHFRLDDHGLAWSGHRLTSPQIAEARKTFALSYGSCSFVEPLDDLRGLRWIG